MSKSTNTAGSDKPAKRYAKTRGEHYKDIVIAVLVASIVAFISGTIYAGQVNERVEAAKASETQPVKK